LINLKKDNAVNKWLKIYEKETRLSFKKNRKPRILINKPSYEKITTDINELKSLTKVGKKHNVNRKNNKKLDGKI
jgi:hypothetical protein